jgi:putative ABC transport system permease protein
MNVISRGMRNAFRNLTRTVSIVIILGLSIGLAMVMLIANQAVNSKINQVEGSIGTAVNIEPAGYDSFSGANNVLTVKQLRKVSSTKHVTGVTELLAGGLQTNGTSVLGNVSQDASTSLISPDKLNKSSSDGTDSYSGAGYTIARPSNKPLGGNVSLPVDIVGSTNPIDPVTVSVTSLKLVGGRFINGTANTNQAMISQGMASKNNLHLGSTFTAYSKTLTVVGIFNSDTDSGNNHVIVSLPAEQRLSGQSGDVSSAYATIDSLDHLASATRAIHKELGNADVTSLQQQAEQALQPLDSTRAIALYSLIGAVSAGAIIILLTMIMIVRERKREIGVIKAIGFSNLRIMSQFMVEAVTFTALGAVIGLAIGFAGGSPITSELVKNSTPGSSTAVGGLPQPGFGLTEGVTNVHAAVGWLTIADGLGAALIIAVIGSALASFFIAKVRPAEVLRSE